MGRRRRKNREKQRHTDKTESYTLPPSPSHSFSSSSSSSSSDFEFSISISPRKSSTLLCPADELFYKGQLLPLHLSPRISMVRTLLLSSPSSSSYSAPRDSTASTTSSSSFITNDCDSSRPSSATDDDNNHFFNRHNNAFSFIKKTTTTTTTNNNNSSSSNSNTSNNRYFSFSRFSSVFRKPRNETESVSVSEPSSVKRSMGNTAKEVIRKYLKKVKKPLYNKFSQKQKEQKTASFVSTKTERSANETGVCSMKKNKKEITESNSAVISSSYSFSGNLRYPRRRNNSYISSCPSSMRSSPTHSGVLPRSCYSDASTIEELQNAIQGAIAHCKNSLVQNNNNNNNNKTVVSYEI